MKQKNGFREVWAVYLVDSRGISMRYTVLKDKDLARAKVKMLKPIFPSLKRIEIHPELIPL